jgi:hypothetical protein
MKIEVIRSLFMTANTGTMVWVSALGWAWTGSWRFSVLALIAGVFCALEARASAGGKGKEGV